MNLTKSQLRDVAWALIDHSCDAIDMNDSGHWSYWWCMDCGMSHTEEAFHFRPIDHHSGCTVGNLLMILQQSECFHSREELDHVIDACILRLADRN